jgi:hypothetical protein
VPNPQQSAGLKKKKAYITQTACVFEGIYRNAGDRVETNAEKVPNHLKPIQEKAD